MDLNPFRILIGFACCLWGSHTNVLAGDLIVKSDFEGASVRVLEIDSDRREISFMPGGDPVLGWPCWWYFRIEGIIPNERITLKLSGSNATSDKPNSPLQKPLASSWAMPLQATYSTDNEHWIHSEKGEMDDGVMVYQVSADSASLFVAWGPPYTPSFALNFIQETESKHQFADATPLCQSREQRTVPMLRILEGHLSSSKRFGVWVQARQHAWECGSSWVAHGFAEWLLSDEADAIWLRQHAEIYVVPIMDVDHTATGNGGKDAFPQDHNRDWSKEPHWNEVRAAQEKIGTLIGEGRMDVFLDLHNPSPTDPTFFYLLDRDLLSEPMIGLRDRFVQIAYNRISKIKPLIPMSNRPKLIGASYHPLWREMSAHWVSLNGNPQTVGVCLETVWNYSNSTTDGYRAVGANLAASVREFLAEQPLR